MVLGGHFPSAERHGDGEQDNHVKLCPDTMLREHGCRRIVVYQPGFAEVALFRVEAGDLGYSRGKRGTIYSPLTLSRGEQNPS